MSTKFRNIVFVLVILSLVISTIACDDPPQPRVTQLDPNDPNAIAQCEAQGQESPCYTAPQGNHLLSEYGQCLERMNLEDPKYDFLLTHTDKGAEAARIFNCGAQIEHGDFYLVPALALSKITPFPQDDAAVAGIIAFKTGGELVILIGGAYLAAHGIDAVVTNTETGREISFASETVIETEMPPLNWAHNPAHDVEANLPAVNAMLDAHKTWVTTGGPNNRNTNQDFVCKVLKVGQQIISYSLWQRTGPGVGSQLVWTASRWVTFYPDKAFTSLGNPPVEISRDFPNARVEAISCSNLPPMPPLATP
jgi:hypothetical protein